MLPPAPGLFSITTCWPQISESLVARLRAKASLAPPAANGTTSFTKREGHAVWANAGRGRAAARAEAVASLMVRRRVIMVRPPCARTVAAGPRAHNALTLPVSRAMGRIMNVQSKPSKLIKGATGDWEVVIGMEVHAQVTSNSKLFSGASTAFGGEPNTQVSLVDAAMPGMLPVINEECIAQAIRTGLGLKAKINLSSVFDRKNYFYPDLPQGYQISQYKSPVVGEGEVIVDLLSGESIKIGIERLHLE